jgi:hypothetical protein
MKTWLKVLIVTFVFAVPAFLLGPVIWPISADIPAPAPEMILTLSCCRRLIRYSLVWEWPLCFWMADSPQNGKWIEAAGMDSVC